LTPDLGEFQIPVRNKMNVATTEYGRHNLGLFVLPPPHSEWEKKHGAPDLE